MGRRRALRGESREQIGIADTAELRHAGVEDRTGTGSTAGDQHDVEPAEETKRRGGYALDIFGDRRIARLVARLRAGVDRDARRRSLDPTRTPAGQEH
jgi:hypothetical protein